MAHSINLQPQSVSIMDTGDYCSIAAIQAAINIASGPVLLVATASELPDVLSILRPEDDICLHETPEILKSFRHRRLENRQQANSADDTCVDALTRLLNRQTFCRALRDAATTATQERPASLILCDIDNFKQMNDTFGHAAGDEMLCLIADCFRKFVGSDSLVGRFGGDEFAILCPLNNNPAKGLASTLRDQLSELETHAGARITMSLGIATADCSQKANELLEKANKALYAAKSKGRNCWICIGDLETQSRDAGHDIEVTGLENMARVLAERVANVITMRSRKLLNHVREEADVDGLTGCFNRRYLDRRLACEFDSREDSPLSIAFLDLDYFGQVNKKYGWSTGDKLLVDVCNTIRDHIREGDWIGRYGGEEFCIVMPNTTASECRMILSRIRQTVELTQYTSAREESPISMTVSIGAACATSDDGDFSEVLERASEMALTAKRNGRNQLCVATTKGMN